MARILPSLGLASLVFGHVSGGGFTAGDTFLVGGREIRSDSHANYTVVLDPGEYTVTFVDHHGAKWVATISSDSGPIKQDITFRKQ